MQFGNKQNTTLGRVYQGPYLPYLQDMLRIYVHVVNISFFERAISIVYLLVTSSPRRPFSGSLQGSLSFSPIGYTVRVSMRLGIESRPPFRYGVQESSSTCWGLI